MPQRNTPGLSSPQGVVFAGVCRGSTQGGCLQSWLDAGASGGRARPLATPPPRYYCREPTSPLGNLKETRLGFLI